MARPTHSPGRPTGWRASISELYRVPDDAVDLERQTLGSQRREANSNIPLIWTQSLAWVGEMLLEGLISNDLDPCERRHVQGLVLIPCWWRWHRRPHRSSTH